MSKSIDLYRIAKKNYEAHNFKRQKRFSEITNVCAGMCCKKRESWAFENLTICSLLRFYCTWSTAIYVRNEKKKIIIIKKETHTVDYTRKIKTSRQKQLCRARFPISRPSWVLWNSILELDYNTRFEANVVPFARAYTLHRHRQKWRERGILRESPLNAQLLLHFICFFANWKAKRANSKLEVLFHSHSTINTSRCNLLIFFFYSALFTALNNK